MRTASDKVAWNVFTVGCDVRKRRMEGEGLLTASRTYSKVRTNEEDLFFSGSHSVEWFPAAGQASWPSM